MGFDIHSIYRQIFKVWREKRQKLFQEIIKPQSHEILLDVGGHPSTWAGKTHLLERIDCLNVYPIDYLNEDPAEHRINTLVGDGCDLSYEDRSYDIAFSNSVIEHVGDWERQVQFAKEVRRVGKKLWVQTPAFECPLEPHFLAPFVHWCPVTIRKVLVRWLTPWGWLTKPTKEQVADTIAHTRLLSKREMKTLFPDCNVLTERMLWIIPKSYIAHRTNQS